MRIKILGTNRILVGWGKGMRYPLTSHLSPLTTILLPLTSLFLTGCEKTINIDYRTAETQYVVEASVTATGMTARVSTTNSMYDNSGGSDIGGADIMVTGSDGSSQQLYYTSNGFYRSTAKGTPGVTYTIDVGLDGQHFTSTSTMQSQPTVNSFKTVRQKITTEWFQMGDLRIQDQPNEDNWYFMHIYRNNVGYRWAVMSDRNNPNQELQQMFSFFREGTSGSDVLQEGDRLRIEVRAIDHRAYDYLYSMQVMDATGTNPIKNFTGGCLGYFSAYDVTIVNYTYHSSEVTDAE